MVNKEACFLILPSSFATRFRDHQVLASDKLRTASTSGDLRRSRRMRIVGDSRVRSSNQRRFHFSGRRLATSTPVISSTSPLLSPRPHQPHRRASPPSRAIAIESRRPFTSSRLPRLAAVRLRARRSKGQSLDTRSLARGNPLTSTTIALITTSICPGDPRPTSSSTAP